MFKQHSLPSLIQKCDNVHREEEARAIAVLKMLVLSLCTFLPACKKQALNAALRLLLSSAACPSEITVVLLPSPVDGYPAAFH